MLTLLYNLGRIDPRFGNCVHHLDSLGNLGQNAIGDPGEDVFVELVERGQNGGPAGAGLADYALRLLDHPLDEALRLFNQFLAFRLNLAG